MGPAEVFTFSSQTNLNSNPITRFSPQPILPSTPDWWFISSVAPGILAEIAMPNLDQDTGPIYGGKSVNIVNQSISNVDIILWDAVGAFNTILSLTTAGESANVTAFWDSVSGTGSWQVTRLS